MRGKNWGLRLKVEIEGFINSTKCVVAIAVLLLLLLCSCLLVFSACIWRSYPAPWKLEWVDEMEIGQDLGMKVRKWLWLWLYLNSESVCLPCWLECFQRYCGDVGRTWRIHLMSYLLLNIVSLTEMVQLSLKAHHWFLLTSEIITSICSQPNKTYHTYICIYIQKVISFEQGHRHKRKAAAPVAVMWNNVHCHHFFPFQFRLWLAFVSGGYQRQTENNRWKKTKKELKKRHRRIWHLSCLLSPPVDWLRKKKKEINEKFRTMRHRLSCRF